MLYVIVVYCIDMSMHCVEGPRILCVFYRLRFNVNIILDQ